ncbi:molybdopterin-dependent oxidoreductase [Xinfangfangia sp. CPCC 101601]|uniref:Molybdopterin-dependent oxidoreductase n=1 Tax=Pseudogemmobacter lacusdianii TaxID=3069608 RepID=A0ABU0VUB8_9RHOB|nr:molybdopterin-dependent oxidoreductase [Xinfangfangia sp. CPCC 101601]MDQ2065324.1 molybdopterin-dependent oxidoreductase [Xinfangfangia sp. CPCC 101601]
MGHFRRRLILATIALFAAAPRALSEVAPEGALPAPSGPVILEVSGKISRSNSPDGKALFDADMLATFPPQELTTATTVTDGVNRFDGILMRDLLNHLGAEGEVVRAIALNDYVIDIPIEDFTAFDVILAHSMDGERLSQRTKGPLWIVYPRDDHPELDDIRYDYRWVWQLQHIEIR